MYKFVAIVAINPFAGTEPDKAARIFKNAIHQVARKSVVGSQIADFVGNGLSEQIQA